ncbi:MAG: copper transporter [Frankiaceae bacterium]
MIDFRYHVVSIVAVFLAGAIGLVLGTTTINGVVLKDLNNRVNQLTNDKSALRGQLSDTQSRLGRDDAFAAAAEQPLVADRLVGDRVVIIEAPGASDALTGRLAQAVLDAGGTVASELKLNRNYVDPDQSARLSSIVTSLAPASVTLPEGGATPSQRAAYLLAALLMAHGTSGSVSSAALEQLLSGLESARMLKVRGTGVRPGDLALVVSGPGSPPGATPAPSASAGTQALSDLVAELDADGDGAVVAGPAEATRSGALLAAVRGNDVADTVSTVDSADTSRGRVATVFALAAQRRGDAGAYGQAAAGDSALPGLEP